MVEQHERPLVTDRKRAERQRLAEALRANLKRRKAAVARGATAPETEPAGDETQRG